MPLALASASTCFVATGRPRAAGEETSRRRRVPSGRSALDLVPARVVQRCLDGPLPHASPHRRCGRRRGAAGPRLDLTGPAAGARVLRIFSDASTMRAGRQTRRCPWARSSSSAGPPWSSERSRRTATRYVRRARRAREQAAIRVLVRVARPRWPRRVRTTSAVSDARQTRAELRQIALEVNGARRRPREPPGRTWIVRRVAALVIEPGPATYRPRRPFARQHE